jgi:hypothetical protein
MEDPFPGKALLSDRREVYFCHQNQNAKKYW